MGRQRHKRGGDEARRVSVEAKVFILDLKRQKGILQGVIKERRKNVSSWVGMGPTSLRFFLERVEKSFQVKGENQWS